MALIFQHPVQNKTSKTSRTTASVCPVCLQRIDGQLRQYGDRVILEKTCPEHGQYSVEIWRGTPEFKTWYRPKIPFFGGPREPNKRGCPKDCGLCEQHSQRTCTALLEITSRCNLGCPVCFADSGTGEDLSTATIQTMLDKVMEQTGGCNIQLSGGEPTVRDDLPEIVALARKAGFNFVQVNSNGLRLADDPAFVRKMADAGLSSIFLQFDGVTDDIYVQLRGRALFAEKCRAVENCAAAGIGIVLVPTVVPGLNTSRLWDIVRFGLERQPQVRGVHFQPISYFGRFPHEFRPEHITLPEVMSALAEQSSDLIQVNDFKPPGCEHSLCSFSARYLVREDGTLQLLGNRKCDCDSTPVPAEQGALTSIGVTARQWSGVDEARKNEKNMDALSRFIYRARTHTFSVSGMAFQDCWTLMLERLQGCCIHVAQPDGRLIPFCSYNLTSKNGKALHRAPLSAAPGTGS
jgi:uncharacterized radical SAM superfamily Fe-S cluster-containing enzyme